MKTLKSADTNFLKRKSSISQHMGILCVKKKGEWCPLVADVIDAIQCDKIYSHKAGLTDDPTIGYTFPVKTCKYISDLYLVGQRDEVELRKLPEWFGTGFYPAHVMENVFLNADNGALGLHQEKCVRVGLDYVTADHMLKPADTKFLV